MKSQLLQDIIRRVCALLLFMLCAGCNSTKEMQKMARGLPEATDSYAEFQQESLNRLAESTQINRELVSRIQPLGRASQDLFKEHLDSYGDKLYLEILRDFDSKALKFLSTDLSAKIDEDFWGTIDKKLQALGFEIADLRSQARNASGDAQIAKKLKDKELQEQYIQALAAAEDTELREIALLKYIEIRDTLEKDFKDQIKKAKEKIVVPESGWTEEEVSELLSALDDQSASITELKVQVAERYALLKSAQTEVANEVERGVWGRAAEAINQISTGAFDELKGIGKENIAKLPFPESVTEVLNNDLSDLLDNLESKAADKFDELTQDISNQLEKKKDSLINRADTTLANS